jgi:hypothetical protein
MSVVESGTAGEAEYMKAIAIPNVVQGYHTKMEYRNVEVAEYHIAVSVGDYSC